MVNLEYAPKFQKSFKKLDNSYKIKVEKLLIKILDNPQIGKPMQHNRKGTRELYAKPFRLSYAYIVAEDKLIFLDIYHKDEQ